MQSATELQVVVHDDACHLQLTAESHQRESDFAQKLTSLSYILGEFHARGHVGEWCKLHCLPTAPANRRLPRGFPTSIAEMMNSELSPLGHTIHQYGQWASQLFMNEVVDVRNMDKLRSKRLGVAASQKRAAVAQRKMQRRGRQV